MSKGPCDGLLDTLRAVRARLADCLRILLGKQGEELCSLDPNISQQSE